MTPSEDKSAKEQPTGKESLDDQIQQVFSLMVSASRGQVANDDVENAVSKILVTSHPAKAATESEIQQDTDDYDNIDEEEPVNKRPKRTCTKKWAPATIESMREDDEEEESDPLDQIPLGKAGARMMVTFGDGQKPNPEAVLPALLGARKCLHVAIKDARALRRQQKDEYTRARKVVLMGKKHTRGGPPTAEETNQESAGANMLYRAMEGYDKLAYDPKCGFDIEQLKQLFPEEMQAYNRFNQVSYLSVTVYLSIAVHVFDGSVTHGFPCRCTKRTKKTQKNRTLQQPRRSRVKKRPNLTNPQLIRTFQWHKVI
jgi:hypothetical protein